MRRWVEYAAYRFLAALVPLLPRRGVVWLGRRLGALHHRLSPRSRRVGFENLRRALPERADHAWILLESSRLQGAALLDALWSARLTAESARDLLEASGEDVGLLLRLLGRGHGLVMATAHFGSWEMLNQAAKDRGLPRAIFIARPVRNALVDRHLRRQRERSGNRLVYREKALHACMGALRAGEIVCSVIDMAVLPSEGGIFADFLGTPALTSGALPLLAAARRAPLVFAVASPVGGGLRYRLHVEEIPVREGGDRDAEVLRLTLEMNRALERLVRKQPEAWIWSYKRWKSRPSELPGAYPSYALWVHPKW